MPLRTPLTAMFGIEHPVVLAPMGGVSGGTLAAAVSEGGGLGLIGAGRGDVQWLDRECGQARAATSKPWGIGFLAGAIRPQTNYAAGAPSPWAVMAFLRGSRPASGPGPAAGVG